MNQFNYINTVQRPYERVEASRRAVFLRYMAENPRVPIKFAAQITGIKYARATAIYRKHLHQVQLNAEEDVVRGNNQPPVAVPVNPA